MWRTLARFPNTRLGRLAELHRLRSEFSQPTSRDEVLDLCDDYNLSNDEYFFDRHPHSFLSIINYYRTGKLHLIDNMCAISFDDDLVYWDIQEFCFELCCQQKFTEKKEQLEEETKKESELLKDDLEDNYEQYNCCSTFRGKMWDLFEHPDTSKAARVCL